MNDAVLDSQDIRRRRGAALKAARQASGLSARKLVDRVNDRTAGSDLTDHAIYAYEAGRVLLAREAAERIATVLKVPVGELLVGDPDFRPVPAAEPAPAGPHTDKGASAPGLPGLPPGLDEAHVHRLLNVCESVLARGDLILPALDTLARQLERARVHVPSAQVFEAGFGLGLADLHGLLDAPEADWIQRQADDGLHAPLRDLLRHARDLATCLTDGYEDLKRQARKRGDCAPGCAALLRPMRELLDALTDDFGRVRRITPTG